MVEELLVDVISRAVPTDNDDRVVEPNVDIPATFKLPLASILFGNVAIPATVRLLSSVVPEVLMPAIVPAAAVTVTTPAEIGETVRLVPKSIVPAVPTKDPPSLTITPDPDAVIPVNPDPSPTNVAALNVPLDELNVRLLPVFGAILPVASVEYRRKHEVSDDSSATVTFVAVVAVPVTSPENDVAVRLPVISAPVLVVSNLTLPA